MFQFSAARRAARPARPAARSRPWGPLLLGLLGLLGQVPAWGQRVAAGAYHSVAVHANGTLWAWGYNDYGQLGDGTTAARSAPEQIGSAAWLSVAAGTSHTLAVRADGTLWAWGSNAFGQLGTGPAANQLVPVQIGTAITWRSVSAGLYHSAALQNDGTLWAWGANAFGRLGDGATADQSAPVPIGAAWGNGAAGYQHSAAIRTNGTLWAWGYNDYGQLGDSTTAAQSAPEQIGRATWLSVAAGYQHTVAVRADGTYWAWGNNQYGQLGQPLGQPANSAVPLLIGEGGPLPVELVSFTARRTGPASVRLAWQTASERLNAGFTVERAADGRAFAALGTVPGQGTSSTAHAYAFTAEPAPAAAYYRLVQRDQDGTAAYSPVVFVAGAAPGPWQPVPNPAHDRVQLPGLGAAATVQLLDALGRSVRTGTGPSFSLRGLPAGLYLLQATAPGQPPRTARLVVE